MRRAVSEQSNDFAEAPHLEAVRDHDYMLRLRRQPRQDVRLGVGGSGTAKLSEVVMQESIEPCRAAPLACAAQPQGPAAAEEEETSQWMA